MTINTPLAKVIRPISPLELAVLFRDTYESLAPDFGCETRAETREFDPGSSNGQLMVATCARILASVQLLTKSEPCACNGRGCFNCNPISHCPHCKEFRGHGHECGEALGPLPDHATGVTVDAASREVSDWMPIRTVPRDVEVLVCGSDLYDIWHVTCSDGRCYAVSDGGEVKGATHWMSLPARPMRQSSNSAGEAPAEPDKLVRPDQEVRPGAPEVHPSLALESSEMPYRIFTDSGRIWLDDDDGGSLFAYVREAGDMIVREAAINAVMALPLDEARFTTSWVRRVDVLDALRKIAKE